jgi:hypothetical protein
MSRIYQDNSESLSITEELAEKTTLNISETIAFIETLEETLGKYLDDAIVLSEGNVNAMSSVLTDAITIATEDLVGINQLPTLILDDLVTITEALERGGETMHISFEEVIGILDSLQDEGVVGISKTLAGDISIIESAINALGVIKADVISIAEGISIYPVKHLEDSLSIVESPLNKTYFVREVSDSIALAESVQEIQELWFTMVRCSACHAGI